MPKALSGYIVPVRITIAVVVSAVAIALILLYRYNTEATVQEQLEFCAAVLGGAAVVYAGYYAGASLQVSVKQSRKDKAFEILHGFNEVDMAKTRRLVEKKLKDRSSITPDELYQRIMGDDELLGAITVLLGWFEDISIAVQEDHADEKVLYRSLSF